MAVKEFWFTSCGAGMIYARSWEPNGKPKGILQIVHGIVDHCQRYDDFASFMAQQGYLVVAEDHMGHGKSGGSGTTKGYFDGGWFCAVDDSYALLTRIKAEYPHIPYFVFGHSMGSYMTLTILEKYPNIKIDGCILCGSGWQLDVALSAGLRLSTAACRISGEKQTNKRLFNLIVNAFNLRVKKPQTPYDWTNQDKDAVACFLTDPLCDFTIKSGLSRDLMQGIMWVQAEKNFARIDKQIPFCLISGKEDPVGLYGEGVSKLSQELRNIGVQDLTIHLYPKCRHELIHELNKDTVYQDVLSWVNNRL